MPGSGSRWLVVQFPLESGTKKGTGFSKHLKNYNHWWERFNWLYLRHGKNSDNRIIPRSTLPKPPLQQHAAFPRCLPGSSHMQPCLLRGCPFPSHICVEREWLNSKCSLQSNCFAEASIPWHQTHEYDIWVDPAVFEHHSWRKLWWANPWVRTECCRIKVAIKVWRLVCIYLTAFHQDLWQPGKYTPGTWRGSALTGR